MFACFVCSWFRSSFKSAKNSPQIRHDTWWSEFTGWPSLSRIVALPCVAIVEVSIPNWFRSDVVEVEFWRREEVLLKRSIGIIGLFCVSGWFWEFWTVGIVFCSCCKSWVIEEVVLLLFSGWAILFLVFKKLSANAFVKSFEVDKEICCCCCFSGVVSRSACELMSFSRKFSADGW